MQRSKGIGISLPKEFMQKIDVDRGDISRSKYVLRILEKYAFEDKNVMALPDRRFRTLQSGTSVSQ